MGKDDRLVDLGDLALFDGCSLRDLKEIARNTTWARLKPGHTLTVEDQRGLEFFVIVDGTVAVSRDGDRLVRLGPGDHFGELALLDGAPRSATVTATTAVSLLVMERREFLHALEAVPRFAHNLHDRRRPVYTVELRQQVLGQSAAQSCFRQFAQHPRA